jgi:hypothetical protein
MYTQKKPIENAHIVRERDRRRFRELSAVLCLGVPIGIILAVITWQNLEVIRLGHEATRLQKTRKDIEDANKALQLQLDQLTSLAAVQQKASTLGFEPTQPAAIVMVNGVGQAIVPVPSPVQAPQAGQAGLPDLHRGAR